MKVPLRGRGGKQDRPQESKSAFSFHLSVTHTFPQPEGQRSLSRHPLRSLFLWLLGIIRKMCEPGVALVGFIYSNLTKPDENAQGIGVEMSHDQNLDLPPRSCGSLEHRYSRGYRA